MASTAVQVCNLALYKINGKTIGTLDSDSSVKEERVCGDVFDDALEEFLTTFRWGFAKGWASLDATSNGSGGYATPNHEFNYEFGLPEDFISLKKFYGDIGSYAFNGRTSVYTNTTEVAMTYIKKQEDYSQWNPAVIAAFTSFLASKLCVPLGMAKLLPGIMQDYAQKYVRAINSNTEQEYKMDMDTDSDNLWSKQGR
jgi:hypothetical protein